MKPSSAPASAAAAQTVPLGILLAAGSGSRFAEAGGEGPKLLAPLTDGPETGLPIAFVAARRMRAALPRVVAVVREGDGALADWLSRAGCDVFTSAECARGMGASLAAAIRAFPSPSGWVVGLADMPSIAPATIQQIAQACATEDAIVAPAFEGRRGHPVAFGAAHGPALALLDGDIGARTLVASYPVEVLNTRDGGVVRDIDRPRDLLKRSH
ncbi:nucleotidyltransferase family protein [Chitinasiproducens palmae]|nr:nucleotidyltransferase family protein [Chitinasiproducens palmae]